MPIDWIMCCCQVDSITLRLYFRCKGKQTFIHYLPIPLFLLKQHSKQSNVAPIAKLRNCKLMAAFTTVIVLLPPQWQHFVTVLHALGLGRKPKPHDASVKVGTCIRNTTWTDLKAKHNGDCQVIVCLVQDSKRWRWFWAHFQVQCWHFRDRVHVKQGKNQDTVPSATHSRWEIIQQLQLICLIDNKCGWPALLKWSSERLGLRLEKARGGQYVDFYISNMVDYSTRSSGHF